ncbi:MAG: trypsin-like peptidase domain-containing protein [Bdellovibrionales bacterium]|nr:trypsin-like peptidase domain-containing protein [Bdellovibrionales bacterium]
MFSPKKYFIPLPLLLALASIGCQPQHSQKKPKQIKNSNEETVLLPKVIYGSDNRKDIYEVAILQHQRLAKSTVALIRSSSVNQRSDNSSSITAGIYGIEYGLCKDEPFYDQPNGAFCSGFLVAPDTIVTAGHCVGSQSECERTNFVFDYGVFAKDKFPKVVPSSGVYNCKKLIHSEVASTGSDFAVIQLDREVTDRSPLKLRQTGVIPEKEPLLVIGHPAGLPTKVADGASVRSVSTPFFTADLDTYGGNSGSAVFNEITGEVEGILVRGETDFTYRNGCRASNVCNEGSCRGEDVTKITQALPYIPAQPLREPASEDLGYTVSLSPNLEIPDNSATGILVTIPTFEAPGDRSIYLSVNIEHPWRGDLIVKLIAPNGQQYTVSSRSGGSRNDIVGTFPIDKSSWQGSSQIPLTEQTGDWALHISDRAYRDVGTIKEIELKFSHE